MIYVALVALAALAALAYEKHQNIAQAREWAAERSSLITRIQHPEIVVGPPEQVVPDEELYTSEVDEIALVGTINPDD